MRAILLFCMICISPLLQAQQKAVIDSCMDSTSVRPTADQLSELFSARGLYLDRKYDWSDPTINCHINKAINFHVDAMSGYSKISRRSNAAMWLYIPGGAFLFTGLLFGNTGLLVPGILLGGVSVALIIGNKQIRIEADKKRIESDYHYGEVNKYYRSKGW